MRKAPFSSMAIILLVASAVALFSLSFLLHAWSDDLSGNGYKANSWSKSAIGHAGFYELLRRLDYPVLRARSDADRIAGESGTLLLIEPDLNFLADEEWDRLLDAPRVLLVLPKWRGEPDIRRSGWISEAKPVSLFTAERALSLAARGGAVERRARPERWSVNDIGISPETPGDGKPQLVVSKIAAPLVAAGGAALLSEVKRGDSVIWVLSDPDILSNHGLGKGENAAFMIALIDALRMSGKGDLSAPVVFDETIHGFTNVDDTIVKMMLRFPFVIVTILVVLSALFAAWSGGGRFGAPRPVAPPLDFGKKTLIDNGARLLDYAGYHDPILRRYVRVCLRQAARALHAPPDLDDGDMARWLDRIGESRGVSKSCFAILESASPPETETGKNTLSRLYGSVRDIHRWKGEILNGPATSRRGR